MNSETISKRPMFTTIDDLRELATKLVEGLNKLGERRDPLAIRKGVSDVVERRYTKREDQDKGEMLKTASKTYFFDIKETRGGKPYLVITESRLMGEGEKPERSSIMIFQESIQDFADIVNKMADKIAE